MSKPFSATPFLTQLYKALHEEGHELFIIPYSGKSISSPWWTCYDNPNYQKGEILGKIIKKSKISMGNSSNIIPFFAKKFAKPNLEKSIKKILTSVKEIDVMLFIAVPLNQISGLASSLRKSYDVPVLFYDVDLPTSLPEYGGFSFNYYPGADLAEYDCFLITSEGSKPKLLEMGARNVETVHIGIDPTEYTPVKTSKDIDFFFYGHNGKSRIDNLTMMVTEPSKKLDYNFVVGGRDYPMDLGNSQFLGEQLEFSKWIRFSCRAKINLNIVHDLHAKVFATSTARPFELSALGCCIVSSPYNGLEKWFDTKKEILLVKSEKECIEIYKMLMDDEELRHKMGNAAQQRVKNEHTSRHRARQMIEIIKKFV